MQRHGHQSRARTIYVVLPDKGEHAETASRPQLEKLQAELRLASGGTRHL
jgi:hypothetical protein